MINFFKETKERNVSIDENRIVTWLNAVIKSEEKKLGEINFIFCDDDYLLEINQKFLNHDTYTDIISFDNTLGNLLGGDIFISHERVVENASTFGVLEDEEMRRVIVHGVLHLCGYKDKTDNEAELMRQKEDEKLAMFHVEH
ncbi:rRNA maturation RNase YbeY [Aquimarina sp. D1M17]|uniref:rRNA maturation RNase YbeY n=1 Tax=Aquimarina acroporae TaxID=2937283 RepID=UPI0020BDDCE4|nr:rRNA maturation RNase YbeY [Aquimarina acroporae]MCK8523695.1 rRNA maturation RNase YbeY [Aquimarina acroporae]